MFLVLWVRQERLQKLLREDYDGEIPVVNRHYGIINSTASFIVEMVRVIASRAMQ